MSTDSTGPENTPPDAGPTETPATSETHSPPAGKRSPVVTGIAFVAVAALAATAGALIAGGNGSSDDAGASQDVASETGQTETATTAVGSFAEGERRGWDDVHQGGEENLENVLVSTDWLATQIEGGLEESGIVLIDVSEGLASSDLTPYEEGHIPGAQYLDWASSFTQANTREFIDAQGITELLQGIGYDEDDTLVIYGDNNNWFAAYAAWVFNLHGVPDVRLLDGGLKKWEQVDGRELVQEVPQPEPGTFVAKPQNFDIRSFQSDVLSVVDGEQEATLIDIRSADEYDGAIGVDPEIFEGEGASIWGHIPGAVNVGWGSIVNEDGTFKSAEEIREIYTEAGADLEGHLITYCRIGERASHTWFALSQILGLEVSVYDGSWSEWGNTVGVPVVNNSGERNGVWGQRG